MQPNKCHFNRFAMIPKCTFPLSVILHEADDSRRFHVTMEMKKIENTHVVSLDRLQMAFENILRIN